MQQFWVSCYPANFTEGEGYHAHYQPEELTLSWRSELSWVTFHVSSTLTWQCLLTVQFTETSTTKRVFLWYRSQRDVHLFCKFNRLFGLVVRRPPRERKIPGSNPACDGIFSGSSPTSDFKIGTPVATLPGAWRYRVSAGTGRPGVSILWLGEMESLICYFYLSVAARKLVWADPSLRYTCVLLGR